MGQGDPGAPAIALDQSCTTAVPTSCSVARIWQPVNWIPRVGCCSARSSWTRTTRPRAISTGRSCSASENPVEAKEQFDISDKLSEVRTRGAAAGAVTRCGREAASAPRSLRRDLALRVLAGLSQSAAPLAHNLRHPGPSRFTDIAQQAGLTTPSVYGGETKKRFIIETNGAGVALLDLDGDGWLDAIVLNGTRLKDGARENETWPAGPSSDRARLPQQARRHLRGRDPRLGTRSRRLVIVDLRRRLRQRRQARSVRDRLRHERALPQPRRLPVRRT